jgi:putative transposase
MVKEAEQQIGPTAKPCESPVRVLADLRLGLGRGIEHPLLDIPMTLFLRVQVRGVRRQPLHVDLGMLGQEHLDHLGSMGLQAVPDDDHRPSNPTPDVLQMRDRVLAVDRMIEMLLVDAARRCQPDRRGNLTPLEARGQTLFLVSGWRPSLALGYPRPMPRRLRIEYEGAIYHVMARGNARQDIVHDDDDRRRIVADLERAVARAGWEMVGFVVMTNHLHLLVKTPRPNLARGMQAFLSGYALWCGRRRRRPGHLFQGRYKAEMIEDETYYWAVSRYIHLNPVRAGLVARPEAWEWSSYPGYAEPARRRPWVAHDALLAAWRGEHGGADPAAAYRRFTEAGLTEPSPFREAFGGWALGSARFVDRLRSLAGPVTADPPAPEARRLAGLDPDAICTAVAAYYRLDPSALARRHDPHIARAVAAWLCRRHTEAPLRELAARLGLSRADSVPNLTRRIEARLATSPRLAEELGQILQLLVTRRGIADVGQPASAWMK